MRIDEIDGFQVLSMLKLDEETQAIPVVTYSNEYEGEMVEEEEAPEFPGTQIFTPKPVELMN